MSQQIPEEQHNIEIHENLNNWNKKPVLQKVYHHFYQIIANEINKNVVGKIVELGSGIGNLKMTVPEVICTDLFPNPWIDQTESAYKLSFENESVSNLILFDVWHHLQFPGNALDEFQRVLKPGGRVIIFEPSISLFGFMIYGLFHHEPVAYFKKIDWKANSESEIVNGSYYAAQGNASRIFYNKNHLKKLDGWAVIKKKKITSFTYALTGGYSKKQLYPDKWFNKMLQLDRVLGCLPRIFSTRLLIVLEKK